MIFCKSRDFLGETEGTLNSHVSFVNSRKSVYTDFLEFSHRVNILYDQKMTAALITRLLHHCHLLLFTGPDMRLKESSIHDVYARIAR